MLSLSGDIFFLILGALSCIVRRFRTGFLVLGQDFGRKKLSTLEVGTWTHPGSPLLMPVLKSHYTHYTSEYIMEDVSKHLAVL